MKILIILLLIISVIDPQDLLFGLKVPLFIIIWIFFLIDILLSKKCIVFNKQQLFYIFIFSFLMPVYSSFVGIINQNVNFSELYQAYKPFLFLTITIILSNYDIDLVPVLSKTLLGISIMTIIFRVLVINNPNLFSLLYQWGNKYGIYTFTVRNYAFWQINAVYFHTMPLIVIALAYYCRQAQIVKHKLIIMNIISILIIFLAMIIAGTRNTIIMSILIPVLIYYWYSPKKTILTIQLAFFITVIIIIFRKIIISMISIDDISNYIKLQHYRDIIKLLSQTKILLFGQGLGTKFFSEARQREVKTIELTYLDILRKFGFIIGLAYIIMLLIPIKKLFNKKYSYDHYLYIGYIGYLIMSFSNPFIFSSSGMLVLSIILYTYYRKSSFQKE
jgi:hypothetical protein